MRTPFSLLGHPICVGLVLLCSIGLAGQAAAQSADDVPEYILDAFGAPPAVPSGALSPDVEEAAQTVFVDTMTQGAWGRDQGTGLKTIAESGDPRLAWPVSDLMRFVTSPQLTAMLAAAAAELL